MGNFNPVAMAEIPGPDDQPEKKVSVIFPGEGGIVIQQGAAGIFLTGNMGRGIAEALNWGLDQGKPDAMPPPENG